MSSIVRHDSFSSSASCSWNRVAPSPSSWSLSAFKLGEAFLAHESGAGPYVEVYPVLDDLALGDALEEQPRTHTGRVDARRPRRVVEERFVGVDLLDIAQHFAPEAGDANGLDAVEGDLEGRDRRHRATLGRHERGVISGCRMPQRTISARTRASVAAHNAADPGVGTRSGRAERELLHRIERGWSRPTREQGLSRRSRTISSTRDASVRLTTAGGDHLPGKDVGVGRVGSDGVGVSEDAKIAVGCAVIAAGPVVLRRECA